MDAVLEFSLPEDDFEFNASLHGSSMHCALFEFDQWLRNKIKYEDKDWQEIRDELHTIIDYHELRNFIFNN